MNGVMKVPHTWRTTGVVFRHNTLRLVGKAANRSAVHGTKLPIPDVVDVSARIFLLISIAANEILRPKMQA